MNKVLEEISKIGIVPVIALDHVEDAAPLAKALCDGGLPCAEVTFRTAAAEESIRIMAEQFPEMLVGAGTRCKRRSKIHCKSWLKSKSSEILCRKRNSGYSWML